MTIFKIILAIVIALSITACCPKPKPCKACEPAKTITVTETKEVYVPVKCKHDKIVCNFNGKGYDPTVKMLECIVTLKRALESCSEEANSSTDTNNTI